MAVVPAEVGSTVTEVVGPSSPCTGAAIQAGTCAARASCKTQTLIHLTEIYPELKDKNGSFKIDDEFLLCVADSWAAIYTIVCSRYKFIDS